MFIDTTKHYKIWFSANPDRFLYMEDQLRLIRMRKRNPGITLGLLYSSVCLSTQSQEKLKIFCEKHVIDAVDFDQDVPCLLETAAFEDIALYWIAKCEMRNPAGNLGAASDCARLIMPIIEKLGIYSDFDVDVDFSKKNQVQTIQAVKAPIILPAKVTERGEPYINIDFLAFTHDREDKNKLSPTAVSDLRCLQQKVLWCYRNPKLAFVNPPLPGKDIDIRLHPFSRMVINSFFASNPDASLFAFRKFAQKQKYFIFPVRKNGEYYLYKISENDSSTLKASLLHRSVINFSGSNNYFSLYKDCIPDNGFQASSSEHSQAMEMEPIETWRALVNATKNSSLEENDLDTSVHITHSCSIHNKTAAETIGVERDAAWTVRGQERKAERDSMIFSTAYKIFNFWRQKRKISPEPSTNMEIKHRAT
jgi:hypothetical protein